MFGEKNWSSKTSHTVLNSTEIAHLPATPALAKRSRKVEHSQILTSPYKKLLFDSTAKANRKQQKTPGRKQTIQKTSQRGNGIKVISSERQEKGKYQI